jgi:ATP-dependent DNA ligase
VAVLPLRRRARDTLREMATKPKPTSKPEKPALPVALARRAEALSAAKQARLLEEATGLIALVQRRKRQIAEAFYDLGVALGRLKAVGVPVHFNSS